MGAVTEAPTRAEIDAAHEELGTEPGTIPGQVDLDGREVPVEPPAPPVEELRVDGTAQLGFFDAGGKKPASATITLTGGKVELLEGRAYKKGDVVSFSGTAVVHEVSVKDTHDPKTGIVVSAAQGHKARITDLTVAGA